MMPLGLRLNNPGNIRPNAAYKWQGEVGAQQGFCMFDTMANGIRALAKNLIAYYDNSAEGPRRKYVSIHGDQIDTVEEAIYRWAPPADHNDTEAYVTMVCYELDCTRNDKFDFHDPAFLFWTVSAIGHQEQGPPFTQLVSDADIMAGVAAALT